jgi:hypothetical protein
MVFNLLKKYNELLDLVALSEAQRKQSLQSIFKRDFIENSNLCFKNKPVQPTPKNGEIPIATLFTHLTTVVTDEATKKRTFELERSKRLHWVKFHINESKVNEVLHFSIKEPQGIRTYIYDKTEKYVVVLEPLKKINEYYLLTAYHLQGKDAQRNKILKKYKRKLNELL